MAVQTVLGEYLNVDLVKEKIEEFVGHALIVFNQLEFPLQELDFLDLGCDK